MFLTDDLTAIDAQYSPELDRVTSINFVKVRGDSELRFGVYDPERP